MITRDPSDGSVKRILDQALADAEKSIPSEEITYTEMIENLRHAGISEKQALEIFDRLSREVKGGK